MNGDNRDWVVRRYKKTGKYCVIETIDSKCYILLKDTDGMMFTLNRHTPKKFIDKTVQLFDTTEEAQAYYLAAVL